MGTDHPFPTADQLEAFASIVGSANALRPDQHDLSHYTDENRDIIFGRTPLVLKPDTTAKVQEIVSLAAKHNLALVPQGGHTGHAGGAAPSPRGNEIIVALSRLNRLREINLSSNSMTVEAGMLLQTAQQIADAHERLFPLSLGSEGSCMIGGNISTNAGGTGVLAWGNTRDLVLGLEVVLANGEIWNGLSKLKKDNTGYHLKHLFIGAEGTLGIITAATLKLFPKPLGREVAMLATASPADALALFEIAHTMAGNALTAFEIMPATGFDFVFRHYSTLRDPFSSRHPWNLLVEVSSAQSPQHARSLIEAIFAKADESGLVLDAVIGESGARQDELWSIRELLPQSQKPEGISLKHDVSVPVHAVPELIERATSAILHLLPSARPLPFGHMGDGNIHFNVSIPVGMAAQEFLRHAPAINDAIYAIVLELQGSVSAEHGIGMLKRDLLLTVKSPPEMAMMRAIKKALDPQNIMNPGRIFEL